MELSNIRHALHNFLTSFKYNLSFAALQTADPTWYSALTSSLHDYQAKELEEVFRLSEQRRAAAGGLRKY